MLDIAMCLCLLLMYQLTMIGYKDTYNGLIELCGGIYFSHVPAN